VDLVNEDGTKSSSKLTKINGDFWLSAEEKKKRDDTDSDEAYVPSFVPEVPTHPYVICFHLKKHERVKLHVQNMTKYEYNSKAKDNLVLPKRDEALLAVLLADTKLNFQDVVAGKSGGVVVLCQGPPGTGKTLTAETYAEGMRRPLYNVQCSQLGLTPEALEKELLVVFARAARWNAVLLLDEADVYIHQRGSDLHQNAIVGVFLRVLEYYDGVLFMTTNRADTVDDAVLSRCTARITYGVPPVEDQRRIWVLLTAANGLTLQKEILNDIVILHNDLSGRDIKNLVKLCMMVHKHTGRAFNADLVKEMRVFKPTLESK
jgi:SpoVK/Ycf46/Vps4 family AAA+-type ATPase